MADPLSIAASVIAVLGGSAKTFQALQNAWELRHMDQDFISLLNEVTGLKTQLQLVESSLILVGKRKLDADPLKECLGDIVRLRDEANQALLEINGFSEKIYSARSGQPPSAVSKLSKRKWMRRKHTLFRLTAKVTPIVHSLATAASELRSISSEQTLHKLDSVITKMSIQDINFAGTLHTKLGAADETTSLDERLESVLRQSARIEDETLRISRRSSVDSFHSAVSSSSNSDYSTISLSGTLVNDPCEEFCPCQCHITSQTRAPQWVRQIFGSMTFHGNLSVSLSRRPCNKICRRSGPSAVRFTYFAPSWTLLRAFNIYVKVQSIRGLDFNIRMPRVIPDNAAVWSIIEMGRLVALKDMIDSHATSPFDVNTSGKSLLNYAAFTGQDAIYAYLLSVEADPHLPDGRGIAANQPGVDRALSGRPLHRDIFNSSSYASDQLFLDTSTLEQQGFTMLHLILLGLHALDLDMVLKQYPADIDAPDINGRTPLMWAAWRGDVRSVRSLVHAFDFSKSTSVNIQDHEGYSALSRAAEAGHLDCVRELLEAGASLEVTDTWGLQPIHQASGNMLHGLAVVNELLDWNADPNAASDVGTPLHEAANRGSLETVKCLRARGAQLDSLDPDGDSAAMVALICWNIRTYSYLAEVGARLNFTRKTGENIVHLVVWHGSTDVWARLVQYALQGRLNGIDLDAKHDGHNLNHCYHTCRDMWYHGEREAKEKERVKFQDFVEDLQAIFLR